MKAFLILEDGTVFEGKHIGEVLDKLLSDVIEGDISNEKEALSARALQYKKELMSI